MLITFFTAVLKIGIFRPVNDCRSIDEESVETLSLAPLRDNFHFNCPDGEVSPCPSAIYNKTVCFARVSLFTTTNERFTMSAIGVSLVYYFLFIVWTSGIAVLSAFVKREVDAEVRSAKVLESPNCIGT